MPVLFSTPPNPRAAIIVVHEAFGLTSHIGNIVGRLADAGYAASAPALFHRQGSPVFAYTDYDKAVPVLEQLRSGEIDADLGVAMGLLQEKTRLTSVSLLMTLKHSARLSRTLKCKPT